MKSPRQQLYDEVFSSISMLGYRVYDLLPMSEVPYPFIVLKHSLTGYRSTQKLNRDMIVTLNVDTWHLAEDRGLHDKTMFQIEQLLIDFQLSDTYGLKVKRINVTEVTDRTTNDELLHGSIEVTYQIN